MNEVNIFQSSIWLALISVNLYLIWKFVNMSKELKSPATLGPNNSKKITKSQKENKEFNAFNFQELSSIIDEIKQEEDLKKHYKIQKLMQFFNYPIHENKSYKNVEAQTVKNVEVQTVKKESKRKKPVDFRTKLMLLNAELTEAELNLCELIVKEKSCTAIGEVLDLSAGTVRVYKNKLKSKLNLKASINLNSYLEELYY